MKENFIRLLGQQQDQNQGHVGTKINIHFPLKGHISNYCIDLNREIQKIVPSGIDFSPNSYQIPHLTLYMGFVQDEESYTAIMDEIFAYSRNMRSFTIKTTKPYVKKPKGNYVFIDTEQSADLIKIKGIIRDKINRWMKPLSWDVVARGEAVWVQSEPLNFYKYVLALKACELAPSIISFRYIEYRGRCTRSIASKVG